MMWPKYKNITIDRKRNTKSTGVVTTLTPQSLAMADRRRTPRTCGSKVSGT